MTPNGALDGQYDTKRPQGEPQGPQDAPKWTKVKRRGSPDGAKTLPRRANGAPNGAQDAPKRPKLSPKVAQRGPKAPPIPHLSLKNTCFFVSFHFPVFSSLDPSLSKEVQRGATRSNKGGRPASPRCPQEAQVEPKGGPKRPKATPKAPQEGPRELKNEKWKLLKNHLFLWLK